MEDFTLVPNEALTKEIKAWFVQTAAEDQLNTMADLDGDGHVTSVHLHPVLCSSWRISSGIWCCGLWCRCHCVGCQEEYASWTRRRGDTGGGDIGDAAL